MAKLVEDAQTGKDQAQRLADRISGIFVPIVIALPVATLGFWLGTGGGIAAAFTAAVAVLIIACPCAGSGYPDRADGPAPAAAARSASSSRDPRSSNRPAASRRRAVWHGSAACRTVLPGTERGLGYLLTCSDATASIGARALTNSPSGQLSWIVENSPRQSSCVIVGTQCAVKTDIGDTSCRPAVPHNRVSRVCVRSRRMKAGEAPIVTPRPGRRQRGLWQAGPVIPESLGDQSDDCERPDGQWWRVVRDDGDDPVIDP